MAPPVRRLVRWCERFVRRRALARPHTAAAEPGSPDDGTGCELRHSTASNAARGRVPAPAGPERLDRESLGVREQDWVPGVLRWERARQAAVTVGALCARLGISEVRLSRLLNEACGVSAGEFVDGCRLAGLRAELFAEFRLAARVLWGAAGTFAQGLANGSVQKEAAYAGEVREWWRDSARRAAELFAKVGAIRRGANGLEGLAARLGFASGARLRRACLNVLGRSLERIERGLARDVVEFYLACEEREFHTLASAAEESRVRWSARYFLSGDPEVEPAGAPVDRGSFYWEFKRAWVEVMWGEFG